MQFWKLWQTAQLRRPHERLGQALFNALCLMDPELANRVRSTDADPFYHDDRILAFTALLLENGWS